MKYKLINEINNDLSGVEQVLVNRGMSVDKIPHFLYSTMGDVNDYRLLGEEWLERGWELINTCITLGKDVLVIVDADCDGFTSSAILINYLHDLNTEWAAKHLKFFLHDSKQHGLSDCMEYIALKRPDLVILPDASSSDYPYHKILFDNGINILVIDHHEAPYRSEHAVVINNQLSIYPNKDMSGAGVTWQFCRYVDAINDKSYADSYLDLVALGMMADMMDMTQIETKTLIQEGFKEKNIRNPFIYGMVKKNAFSLGDRVTPMGAAFYIAPFVNAMTRSGTLEEKELLFKSMLKHEAFELILSNKRGHKLGEKEQLYEQALRCVTNVKKRQQTAQDNGLSFLEKKIKTENLLEHKALIFKVKMGEVEKNIAGLVANKFSPKYQRPCAILIEYVEDGKKFYRGSARGYEKMGLADFRQVCLDTKLVEYAQGHANAFGLSIEAEKLPAFIEAIDIALKDFDTEPIYYVDYIFKPYSIEGEKILEIADMEDLWGKGLDEALVAIQAVKITPNEIHIYRKKGITLRIDLPDEIAVIKFNLSEEEAEYFENLEGFIIMDIIGKCKKNEWNGRVTPQLFLEDYAIDKKVKWVF